MQNTFDVSDVDLSFTHNSNTNSQIIMLYAHSKVESGSRGLDNAGAVIAFQHDIHSEQRE